jgi:predicted transcriptional regulator of viral defense system
MEFARLIEIVGHEPVFETSLLLAGEAKPANVRRQLSRWTKTGRLYQLRRGLYALAPPFQKVKPHPFVVANCMVRGSYVSCQSALAHCGLIPEHVPVVTSVTTARPARWETPLGVYEFHHIKTGLLHGYQLTDLGEGQEAFVAKPEKALLDLVHLQPGGDAPDYLRELRLQNLDRLDLDELRRAAAFVGERALRGAGVRNAIRCG